jgi:hypothetical protein
MVDIAALRAALLDLHRAVIAHVRQNYERENGRVAPADFLQLLVNDAAYAWLSPLSTAIVEIDEAMDGDPAERDPQAAVASVRSLFAGEKVRTAFDALYEPLLQASPDVLFSHGKVMQALRA